MFATLSRMKRSPFLAWSTVDEVLDEAVILFNEIIEIFHLAQFTAFGNESCFFEFSERFRVRGVFVHVDDTRLAGMSGSERFEKEALGGFRVSCRAEKEIKRVSLRINRSIEVHPFFYIILFRQRNLVARDHLPVSRFTSCAIQDEE